MLFANRLRIMPHWELFLSLAGLGVAIFSYFATHMGINMPLPLAWGGGILGILLFFWAILLGFLGPQKVPIGPVLVIIVFFSGVVGGAVWLKTLNQGIPTYDIEKVRRHRLRIDLTQYLSQGTIHRDWFLIFLQPTVEHGTGKPVDNTDNGTKKIMAFQKWDN